MPTYDFKNTETDEEFEKIMKIKDRAIFLAENPKITQLIGSPKIVTGVGTNIKVDDGFREAIARVKETHTVNNIPDY